MTSSRLVIAGAGVVGLWTAFHALDRGWRVVILERNGPEHDGCSLGNAGILAPSHFAPLAAPGVVRLGLRMALRRGAPIGIRWAEGLELLRWAVLFRRSATEAHVKRAAPLLRDLALQSCEAYAALAEETDNAIGLARNGMVLLCQSEATLRHEAGQIAVAAELGIRAEVLAPGEIAALDPALQSRVAGGVFYAQDAHLDPRRLMRCLQERVLALGGEIRWGVPVTGWRTAGGRVTGVETSSGVVEADEFVMATGVWSGRLLRGLGLRMPLMPGKGHNLTLAAPAVLPRVCAILVEARVGVTPMGSEVRFAGTMELGAWSRHPDPHRLAGMRRAVVQVLTAFDEVALAAAPVWTGLRPCSPDGLPYIGRPARWENLAIATGHTMQGMSWGPTTGRLVAETLSGEKPSMDIRLCSPDRFSVRRAQGS